MIGLEFIRKQFNLSLADLSTKVGVSRQFISKWETGEKPIPQRRVEKLSEIFNIPQEYFSKIPTEIDKHRIMELKYIHESNDLRDKETDILNLNEPDKSDELSYKLLYNGLYLCFIKALDEIKESFKTRMEETNVYDDAAVDALQSQLELLVKFDLVFKNGGEKSTKLKLYLDDIARDLFEETDME